MEDKTQELLDAVGQLFSQYGVKSLTMDDISRHLGISKKTLYRHVKDKKDLVTKCVSLRLAQNQCNYLEFNDGEGNAIDKLMMLNKMVSMELSQLHPSILYDLQRYYPEAFAVLVKHKEEFIYKKTLENLEMGIQQGLYRDNLDPRLISRIYIEMVDSLFANHKFNLPEISLADFHKEIMRYHIRGIASSRGLKYLVEKFNNSEL